MQDSNSNKWVINVSKNNLTEGQGSALAKGPNFSTAPRHIPVLIILLPWNPYVQSSRKKGHGT